MPIQMLAMMTEISDHCGRGEPVDRADPEPGQQAELTTPESLLNIHDQVDADTISGSSHGTRNSARSVADSGKLPDEEHRERQADRELEDQRDDREDERCGSSAGRTSGRGKHVR